jgi:hypothetical protein
MIDPFSPWKGRLAPNDLSRILSEAKACTKKRDSQINFKITGFTIMGQTDMFMSYAFYE